MKIDVHMSVQVEVPDHVQLNASDCEEVRRFIVARLASASEAERELEELRQRMAWCSHNRASLQDDQERDRDELARLRRELADLQAMTLEILSDSGLPYLDDELTDRLFKLSESATVRP